ncbi:17192_t:CDS:2 [Cetraspora pellucida]|uniref:17192_t:CDS:1 n=1 Tax=Cetraspora pellucida TaxID=1433469 RepID=A0A9N9F798_9GLOM|nr:17192_t:CDS:2 [Cetraspora pellucida]
METLTIHSYDLQLKERMNNGKVRIKEFETEELENEIVKDDELIFSHSIGKTELDDLLQKLKGLQ